MILVYHGINNKFDPIPKLYNVYFGVLYLWWAVVIVIVW